MHLRDAREEDFEDVAKNMTHITRLGFCDANNDTDLITGLHNSVDNSRRYWAFEASDGRLAGLAGVIDWPDRDPKSSRKLGFIYDIPTYVLIECQREFLRLSRQTMALYYVLGEYDYLTSFVDLRHERSFEWCTRWLGFSHIRDIPAYGMSMMPHHEILHTRGVSPMRTDSLPAGYEDYEDKFREMFADQLDKKAAKR